MEACECNTIIITYSPMENTGKDYSFIKQYQLHEQTKNKRKQFMDEEGENVIRWNGKDAWVASKYENGFKDLLRISENSQCPCQITEWDKLLIRNTRGGWSRAINFEIKALNKKAIQWESDEKNPTNEKPPTSPRKAKNASGNTSQQHPFIDPFDAFNSFDEAITKEFTKMDEIFERLIRDSDKRFSAMEEYLSRPMGWMDSPFEECSPFGRSPFPTPFGRPLLLSLIHI